MDENLRTVVTMLVIVVLMSVSGCGGGRIEVVKTLSSPDRDWTISHEFDHRWGQHIVVLRHKHDAHEVARWLSQDMVDLPTDCEPKIAITNETAAIDNRIMWRLERATHRWHYVCGGGTPAKADEPSTQ